MKGCKQFQPAAIFTIAVAEQGNDIGRPSLLLVTSARATHLLGVVVGEEVHDVSREVFGPSKPIPQRKRSKPRDLTQNANLLGIIVLEGVHDVFRSVLPFRNLVP